MSFLLKIVEGPNKGAEIALVEGVAVTLGKGDDCDVILADTTLPDTPLVVQSKDGTVVVGGEELPPFHVRTVGATSFAAGPGDAPWGDLVWPAKEEEPKGEAKVEEQAEPAPEAPEVSEKEPEAPKEEAEGGKRRRGGVGCLAAFVVLLALLAGIVWYFRAALREFCETRFGGGEAAVEVPAPTPMEVLRGIAERYSLELSEDDGIVKLSGNLDTRARRLKATAEAYAARPGVLVDVSDDESFRVSADDALFTLTEGAIKAVAASNRVLVITGTVRTPEVLRKVLLSLAADLPRLRDVDASRVVVSSAAPKIASMEENDEAPALGIGVSPARKDAVKKAAGMPDLPVCGILTTPYPCLVMRNGARMMEGASIGGSVIVRIEADAVTVTNSAGRFTWRP